MWEPGASWTLEGSSVPSGPSSPVALFDTFTDGIRVLLVDQDKESLASIAKMLETCSYKVTPVELGSAALSMLPERKGQFDLLLADYHLPDVDGFKLLWEAVNIELPAVYAMMARIALENGASFFIEKPVNMGFLKNLWQLVLRERIVKSKISKEKRHSLEQTTAENGKQNELKGINIPEEGNERETNENGKQNELKGINIPEEGNERETNENGKQNELKGINIPEEGNERETNENGKPNELKGINIPEEGNNDGSKKKKRSRKAKKKDEECEPGNKSKPRATKKICTEWTEELHGKFMAAVNRLGEGRCYPKEILELMNVPRLTRMQVASHLQKCRNDNWRSPDARKVVSPGGPTSSVNNDLPSKLIPRRFGCMPRIVTSSGSPQSNLQDSRRNYTGRQIYSSSDNNLIQIGSREDTRPTIHPQTREALQYSGSNEPAHILEMQNMGKLPAFGMLSQLPSTLDYTKNEDEVTCTLENLNGISSGNGYEKSASRLDMTSRNSEPILSNPRNVTFQPDYHNSSSNQNQFPDDLLGFLPEIADPQCLSDLLDGPVMGEHNSSTKQCTYDFGQGFSEQVFPSTKQIFMNF
ncbi:hypothetical protein F0562_023902 [Nyssa sinensis]|uniref:Response regulatory domain-containing protein n=1 Tax=Nyssa sinensis TaxID=561372 RepID=A0A5J5BKH4_9ASTE|nr:hypothetical protein F0562_023902 [Nyssa sinensis]